MVLDFLDGPADVLHAATACRRWRELACAGSVWWVKAEREGILDKAAAFEVEVPMVQEGGSLEDEDEERATMAFYARVFVLKVRGRLSVSHSGGLARCANIQPSHRPLLLAGVNIPPRPHPLCPHPPCRGAR